MNKYEIRSQKEKERAIKRTLRKARVPKDATPEQVKAYLIHYISTGKLDYWQMRFTDELMADKVFLASIYRANPNMTLYEKFKPSTEEMQDDIDFMLEFVRISHRCSMKNHLKDEQYNYWSESELKSILKKYDRTVANPEFIVKFAQEFPDVNLIAFIKENLCKIQHPFDKDRKQKEEQDLARFKECLSNLPIELLCNQVKKYTWRALNEIPNDIPNFNQLVSAGIEMNGFRSLERLDITQVLDNIDLVVQAYEQVGIQDLTKYIQHTLSPRRTRYYMCHGEEHDYTEYDKRYEEVQNALLSSPEIQTIFKREKLIAKMKEVKTTRMSIESCASEEDTLIK